MKVMVVFDSRYGNTEKIASDIAKGLKVTQIDEVVCSRTGEVDIEKLGDYDLSLWVDPRKCIMLLRP